MKTYLILLLCVLTTACATTQKNTQATEIANVSVKQSESATVNTERLIDTTWTDKGKITVTEIEFYPPTVATDARRPTDTASSPGTNVSCLNLPDVGNIGNVAIKSIRQTIFERNSEKKGESKESSSTTIAGNEAMTTNTEKTVRVDEAPAPDPYRWRYTFYILLLGVLAFSM